MASFSPISFSFTSFDVGQENAPSKGKGKRNRFRAWIRSLQLSFRKLFEIPKRKKPNYEPEIEEEVEIPPARPPAGEKVTILSSPPTEANPLPMSVVASIPKPKESPVLDIYPLILNPLTIPITQTRIALPSPLKQSRLAEPYRVGEGSHIESQTFAMQKPKNRARAASIISTVMMLMEMEQQLSPPISKFRHSVAAAPAAGGAGIAVALLKRQDLRKRVLRVRFTTQHDAKVDDEICRRLEGKEWDIDDPFIIVPPELTHPNCRCTLKRVNNGNQRVWIPPGSEDLLQYVEDVGLTLEE